MFNSTKATLEIFRKQIEKYKPEHWGGVTKEQLQNNYENFKIISETLTLRELRFICLIREIPISAKFKMFKAAENLYKAYQALDNLQNIKFDNLANIENIGNFNADNTL